MELNMKTIFMSFEDYKYWRNLVTIELSQNNIIISLQKSSFNIVFFLLMSKMQRNISEVYLDERTHINMSLEKD